MEYFNIKTQRSNDREIKYSVARRLQIWEKENMQNLEEVSLKRKKKKSRVDVCLKLRMWPDVDIWNFDQDWAGGNIIEKIILAKRCPPMTVNIVANKILYMSFLTLAL